MKVSCKALYRDRHPLRSRDGFALLDTLLAIAILGVVGIAFLGAVASAEKAVYVSDERTMAESLARRQLESLKASSYINYSVVGHPVYSTVSMPTSYAAGLTAVPINPTTLQPLPSGQDQGLQDIGVTITRNGRTILSIHDYKVAR